MNRATIEDLIRCSARKEQGVREISPVGAKMAQVRCQPWCHWVSFTPSKTLRLCQSCLMKPTDAQRSLAWVTQRNRNWLRGSWLASNLLILFEDSNYCLVSRWIFEWLEMSVLHLSNELLLSVQCPMSSVHCVTWTSTPCTWVLALTELRHLLPKAAV